MVMTQPNLPPAGSDPNIVDVAFEDIPRGEGEVAKRYAVDVTLPDRQLTQETVEPAELDHESATKVAKALGGLTLSTPDTSMLASGPKRKPGPYSLDNLSR